MSLELFENVLGNLELPSTQHNPSECQSCFRSSTPQSVLDAEREGGFEDELIH